MKLTPTMIKGISAAVEDTKLPMSRIAIYSGVTYQTLKNWLTKGAEIKQQLEEGKVQLGEVGKNDKKRLELYMKVEKASLVREESYLEKLIKFADSKEDIGTYQWLLKLQNEAYREVDEDESEDGKKAVEVYVVNLSPCGKEGTLLLSEFMSGQVKDAKKKEGRGEETSDTDKS